jgi:hypothetical protein
VWPLLDGSDLQLAMAAAASWSARTRAAGGAGEAAATELPTAGGRSGAGEATAACSEEHEWGHGAASCSWSRKAGTQQQRRAEEGDLGGKEGPLTADWFSEAW